MSLGSVGAFIRRPCRRTEIWFAVLGRGDMRLRGTPVSGFVGEVGPDSAAGNRWKKPFESVCLVKGKLADGWGREALGVAKALDGLVV